MRVAPNNQASLGAKYVNSEHQTDSDHIELMQPRLRRWRHLDCKLTGGDLFPPKRQPKSQLSSQVFHKIIERVIFHNKGLVYLPASKDQSSLPSGCPSHCARPTPGGATPHGDYIDDRTLITNRKMTGVGRGRLALDATSLKESLVPRDVTAQIEWYQSGSDKDDDTQISTNCYGWRGR